MYTILVVDDELSVRESFSLILEGKYNVLSAASGEAALKTITDQKVDLVYLDIRMPGLNGLETLKRIKEINPDQEVIMVTAVNDIKKAGESVKLGARDYLVKPFDINELLKLTEEILRKKELFFKGKEVRKTAPKMPQLPGLEELEKNIEEIAPKNIRILILGEAGTEKESIASLIHKKSPRKAFPFISFDLWPDLPAQELLFGSSSGASTVELSKKMGLLEMAKGGTLFLNNIEYLSAALIQNLSKEDVRLIAAGSPNLAEKNKEIYDFFAEATLTIPALKERKENLPSIIHYYLEIFNQKYAKRINISPEALEILNSYLWSGNTQELEALLEKLVLASENSIAAADLPFDMLLQASFQAGANFLSSFERRYAQKVLEEARGDRGEAATLLGIKPSSLALFLSS